MKIWEILLISNGSGEVYITRDFTKTAILTQMAFVYSKLTIETLEQGVKLRHGRRFGVFIVKFEHISHLVLVL